MHRLSQQSQLALGGITLSRLLFVATVDRRGPRADRVHGEPCRPTAPTTARLSDTNTGCGRLRHRSPRPAPRPVRSPTSTPTTRPSPTRRGTDRLPGSVPAIVTFSVGDEEFRVLVIDPANVAIATQLLGGKEAPSIPNGVIVRGDPDVNTGWSWHLDPATFEFADMTTEVCDGIPSFVEDGSLTSDRFCPWSAKVEAVEPAPR